jgi:hypothetical protein
LEEESNEDGAVAVQILVANGVVHAILVRLKAKIGRWAFPPSDVARDQLVQVEASIVDIV